jgi:hypothetical protein
VAAVGTEMETPTVLAVCGCGDGGVGVDCASLVETGGVPERRGGDPDNLVEPDCNKGLFVCILGDLRGGKCAEWRVIGRADRDEGWVITSVRNSCEDAER